ncbi:MAG TPA: histidinol-phosphate transaminase [Ignavibacteriaceae bacterium]|nr:histidinol-phosphate transaminase [Ignavibacteriaceae bacterium]
MNIKNLVRENILNLKPYTSARDMYESGILLDANENSFGSTFTGINGLHLNRYPDPRQKDLKKITGKFFSIPEENLFFGVGSDEIIDLLIRIFCEPEKDRVIISEPTYGMYKVACDINNVETIEVLLNDDFQIDFRAIQDKYSEKVKLIFLCSPNNPTGNLLKKNEILNLSEKFNSIIIVDEAYIDFALEGSVIDEIKNYPNLVVLRTFSKAWGLAAIRLGFCCADREIINILLKVKAPYNINSLTRYVLEKAVENCTRRDQYIKSILKERDRLKNLLDSLKGVIKVFESNANFLLLKCESPKKVQKKLAEKGIIIRDRSSQPKLEGCLRVSVGTEEENDLFWNEIKKILG